MRHRLERVPEKDQEIDLTLCDLRSDLLVATQRPALQLDDLEIEFLLQQLSRCSCGVQFVLSQQVSIKARPFQEVLLLIVVRDKGDLFRFFRRHLFVFHSGSSLLSNDNSNTRATYLCPVLGGAGGARSNPTTPCHHEQPWGAKQSF